MSTEPNPHTIPLQRFRTALASPRAEKRLDALISGDSAQEQVRALSVTDLYYLIYDVGLGDSVELLSLCSDEQIQGCVDMEIWDRDQPSIDALLPWLAAIQENGFEFLGRVWANLDAELTSLTLQRCCNIYDKTLEEEVPDEEERPYFETPDTFFQIVITTEDPVQGQLVASIIEDLYRADMVQARHTLMSARSEPAAELEEMSYRWRSGRMADLGYVDFYEALEVFRPIDVHSVHIGEGSAEGLAVAIEGDPTSGRELPVPMLRPIMGRSFLVETLERIEDDGEVEAMQGALLHLVNRVLSAGRLSPGDKDALELATLHATATLSLGLEQVSGGDVNQAVEALRSISMTRLHRLGYSLCLRLSRFARMVAPRALAAGDRSLSVLEAVLARRPFYPMALDNPNARDLRPIESRADLAKIAAFLTGLALRVAIADALGVDIAALQAQEEPRAELDDYVRTALLRSLAGGKLQASPLLDRELEAFRERLQGAPFADDDRARAVAALEAVLDEKGVIEARDSLHELADAWIAELEDSFANLPADQALDSKYLAGLVLATRMD